MIINAAHMFTCAHEYVAVDKFFICHRCEQIRAELPISQPDRKSVV